MAGVMLQILTGDCRDILPTLEPESVQTCVCSPPYWGLRDFQAGDDQLGLESTIEEYLANMVAVFRAVWRVLKPDGTLWINMGDSYATNGYQAHSLAPGINPCDGQSSWNGETRGQGAMRTIGNGLKPKDLCMMPARLAMALQADGWYLRSEIVWHKPNPMPESVIDRPTKAHEMIYLLAKNGGNPLVWRARDTGEWSYKPDLSETIKLNGQDEKKWKGFDYFYDADAIREPHAEPERGMNPSRESVNGVNRGSLEIGLSWVPKVREYNPNGRNKRSVWTADEEFIEIPRWKGFDYFYDAEAIREPAAENRLEKRPNGIPYNPKDKQQEPGLGNKNNRSWNAAITENVDFRNKRSVWTIATQPLSEQHFASYPEALVKPCILSGSRLGDTVLDPFAGSGTTGRVALELGRRAILIELNPDYIELARERTFVTPGFL